MSIPFECSQALSFVLFSAVLASSADVIVELGGAAESNVKAIANSMTEAKGRRGIVR